jgi:hypothetical protein
MTSSFENRLLDKHTYFYQRTRALNAYFCTLNLNNQPHIEKMVDTATE